MVLSFNKLKHSENDEVGFDTCFSFIGVIINHNPEIKVIAAKIGKMNFQFPRITADAAAIMGPRKAAIALIN